MIFVVLKFLFRFLLLWLAFSVLTVVVLGWLASRIRRKR